MKNYFLIFLALMVSSSVFGVVSINATWTQPVQYEDGTQLKYSEILEYRVYYTFSDKIDQKNDAFVKVTGQEKITMEVDIPENVKTNTLRFAVSAVSIHDTESDLSNVMVETFEVESIKPKPKQPTIVTFSVQCDGTCTVKMVD